MHKYEAIELLTLLNKYYKMFKGSMYDAFIVPNFIIGNFEDEEEDDEDVKQLLLR